MKDSNNFHKMPCSVNEILEKLALRYEWGTRLSRGMIWEIWEEIVGSQVALNAWPERFTERDTLIVVVSDSIWMQQLSFQRQLFINGLNVRLPARSKIKDIRFILGDVSEVRSRWTNHKTYKKTMLKKEKVQFPKPAVDAANNMMKPVRDHELKQAMANLYLKYSEQKKHDPESL
ncbi:MAG: hypothetical protein AVO38_15000 [delta proteobacterium ML8_D]|jgi:hypothetical protein|nr:MAG: hypothetical protein AVO38_15000 [delta proteobacterium ML8_D]